VICIYCDTKMTYKNRNDNYECPSCKGTYGMHSWNENGCSCTYYAWTKGSFNIKERREFGRKRRKYLRCKA
jgi:hypothetical protein